jgi:hypothetical protein
LREAKLVPHSAARSDFRIALIPLYLLQAAGLD